MKYYICEGKPDGEYNANSKARKDVEYILNELNFIKFFIPTKYGVQTNKFFKFKQVIDYFINFKIWKKEIEQLKKGDIVLLQYPLINTTFYMDKILKILKEKEIIVIILIHDLDSLRFTNMPRVVYENKIVLKEASYVIAHNSKMKEKLMEISDLPDEKIIQLKIFDYISEKNIQIKKREKNEPIIIAGNLSKEKAEYLKELKSVKNIQFNLYGKGYVKEEGEDNINYKGAFLPEELLTAHLPVIVWKNAAIADFVLKNSVGIVVESLDSINDEIKKITDEEYEKMIQNTIKISENLRNGIYLKDAIRIIENNCK